MCDTENQFASGKTNLDKEYNKIDDDTELNFVNKKN